MNKIIGVILAAGRGSRMKGLTDSCPKCMLTLAGKQLLEWQLAALQKAGLEEIFIVCGYLKERFNGNFTKVENPRWAETNMVSSLLCAFNSIKDCTTIISYSDIVYKSEHINKLQKTSGDICITYDTKWEPLWRLRNENPLDDAETFKEEHGFLQEIGGKAHSINEIKGQYMGLLKFTPKGQEIIKNYIATLEPSAVDKLDMTSLLRALLAQKVAITTCPIEGAWCECDTQEDIAAYEEELQKGNWLHDWRS